MSLTVDDLHDLLSNDESANLEFKEAKRAFDFDKLCMYCSALANEGGGHVVLGVTDRQPRMIVGTSAFQNTSKTELSLYQALGHRVELSDLQLPEGRVVVCRVHPHLAGRPVAYRGAYYMRSGESLVAMTPDQLRRLFSQGGGDYSGEVCDKACIDSLDPAAIEAFRQAWVEHSGNPTLLELSVERLLEDAQLVRNGFPTNAALILLGSKEALAEYFPQAEVCFEYRSDERPGPAQERIDFREGFFLFAEWICRKINDRNDTQHIQDGLFMRAIPTFDEKVVREALLNAVSHRDYTHPGSILVRQFPRRLEVISPGGFPPGVSAENIFRKTVPRNRLIAQTLQHGGLVERAGQGADRMFATCIGQGKGRPAFDGTDDYQVYLTLPGTVRDPNFLAFLNQVSAERETSFSLDHLLVLDEIQQTGKVSQVLKAGLKELVDSGLVERLGHGRGTHYVLSSRYYDHAGRQSEYTRLRGLNKEQNKQLLLNHIERYPKKGCSLKELREVVPALPINRVKYLLQDLKADGKVRTRGKGKGAGWYPRR